MHRSGATSRTGPPWARRRVPAAPAAGRERGLPPRRPSLGPALPSRCPPPSRSSRTPAAASASRSRVPPPRHRRGWAGGSSARLSHLLHVLHGEVEARRRRLRPPLHGCGGAQEAVAGGRQRRRTGSRIAAGPASPPRRGRRHRGGTARLGAAGSGGRAGTRPRDAPRGAAAPLRSGSASPRCPAGTAGQPGTCRSAAPHAGSGSPGSPGPRASPAGHRHRAPPLLPTRGTGGADRSPAQNPPNPSPRVSNTPGAPVVPPSRAHTGVGLAAHHFIATGKGDCTKIEFIPQILQIIEKGAGGTGHRGTGRCTGLHSSAGFKLHPAPGGPKS